MYRHNLSFVIISENDELETILKKSSPIEDCDYVFHTVKSMAEFHEEDKKLDTAYLFDSTSLTGSTKEQKEACTNALSEYDKRHMDYQEATIPGYRYEKTSGVFILIAENGSPLLTCAEISGQVGSIWVLPKQESYDKTLILNYFSRLAVRMKFSADARKQRICFDTLIDSMPDFLWFKDTVGTHLIVNESFCETVGKTKEQIYKKGHCYIWNASKKDEEVCLQSDKMIMDSRTTNSFEESVVTRKGVRLLKSYKSALIDDNGEIFGTCGVAHDVTELRNMSSELKIVLESVPFVVLLENMQDVVIDKNNLFDEYFPEFTDIIGKSEKEWKESLSGKPRKTDKAIEVELQKDGEQRVLVLEEEPILDGQGDTIGKIITLVDISNERSNLEQIKKLNTRLEMASREAERANKAKSNFLSSMSHEIRTPINAVLGMNEIILREYKDETLRGYAENIHSAGNTLLFLINDILDLSKLEFGKMELVTGEYGTGEIFSDLWNLIRFRAEEKGLLIDFEIDSSLPVKLSGDEMRIKQILTNILTNAVKYTEKGSILLKAWGEPLAENELLLVVSVKDTGIGIRKDDMGELFEDFKRLELSKNQHIEGTGLGMGIVVSLLGLMDGNIEVESEYGKGSEFTVKIPQHIVENSPLGDTWKKARSTTRPRKYIYAPFAKILVVDDNAINLEVMKGFLKPSQADIVSVLNGKGCIEALRNDYFHLVFLDHMMPGLDGIETLKQLEEQNIIEVAGDKNGFIHCATKKRLFIIMLTANAVAGAKEEYLSYGFSDYLPKPISVANLEEKLETFLPKDLIQKKVSVIASNPAKATENDAEDAIFDLSCGLHYSDQDTYMELIRIFLSEYEENKQKMELYIKQGDMKNYATMVHGLKGNAKIIGANRLSDCCFIHEQKSKQGDEEFVKAEWNNLTELWAETIDAIKELGHSVITVETPKVTTEQFWQTLNIHDLKDLSAAIDEVQTELDKVYKSLDNFNTKDALQILNRLIDGGRDILTGGRLQTIKYAIDSEYDEDKAMRLITELNRK